MQHRALGIVVALAIGIFASVSLPGCSAQPTESAPTTAPTEPPAAPTADLAVLQAEVERLKKVVPDQAHAMSDVDYHFTNLWFAGKAENWPLADFYWKESLSHMKWAVRIIPVRKDSAGREIKLEDILQSIEQSPYMKMGDVIKEQNKDKFEPTYRSLLEGCYSCHKASEKPYLRPHVPERPATHIINFDAKADWPK
jgi:hypothetical protein